uniref:Uncharacterized protein n=1 Tax=Aegilops tauschii subsp. strangulata TaxID=200361 RepID=A0A452XEL1_AEGTS
MARLNGTTLQAIMLKLGFSERWANIVMSLVNSVSYSILFNGKKLEEYKQSRGFDREIQFPFSYSFWQQRAFCASLNPEFSHLRLV